MNNQLIKLFESNEHVGHRKIIISSAGTSKRNNLKQYLGLKDVLYAEVLPNPSLNQIVDFFRIIQPTPGDIIFGIGGGSVIDFSKLVAIFAETPRDEIKKIIESARFQSIEKVLKLIIVPTLFGSGAEQTPFAVCYVAEKKYSVANSLVVPASVEYIPEINISAPSNIKLANVLDCFCQAAESLTAQNANDISLEFAEKTLRLLVPIAKKYIREKTVLLATKMAEASNLCGKAIAISKTTGPHALSYFLTSTLGWEHGKAVSMTFLFFLHNYEKYHDENNQCKRLLGTLKKHLGNAESTHEIVIKYFISLDLDVVGLACEIHNHLDSEKWVKSVNIERLRNGPNVSLDWFNAENLKSYFTRLSQFNC